MLQSIILESMWVQFTTNYKKKFFLQKTVLLQKNVVIFTKNFVIFVDFVCKLFQTIKFNY